MEIKPNIEPFTHDEEARRRGLLVQSVKNRVNNAFSLLRQGKISAEQPLLTTQDVKSARSGERELTDHRLQLAANSVLSRRLGQRETNVETKMTMEQRIKRYQLQIKERIRMFREASSRMSTNVEQAFKILAGDQDVRIRVPVTA